MQPDHTIFIALLERAGIATDAEVRAAFARGDHATITAWQQALVHTETWREALEDIEREIMTTYPGDHDGNVYGFPLGEDNADGE